MRMFDRISAWSERNMPTRETFERIGWLRPIAHRILLPELWRFHRRSVPRGVALGVIVGVMVPVAQTIFAALFALPVRANVPVAAVTTFITNPLTTPPLWVGAYWLGTRILRLEAITPTHVLGEEMHSQAWELARWLLSDAAPATAVGLVVISIVGALVGYGLAALCWRYWIAHKWRTRRHGRKAAHN
ncbi:DUF2062 domain-containing protein [Sphingomonas sp. SCN 67-18]|uniref:DUF2062 domain-containing protein n=1 Tax=uncultured Sphingomonas sp. TaxID=158754 RepID=UPI000AFF328C